MKRILFLAVVLCSNYVLHAQFSRYIVQFTDKKGTAFSISNPAAYLSSRALERRNRQHIAIDSTDLPVSSVYLDSISHVPNVTVLNISRWLNQVLIRTTDSAALATIHSFSFVKQTAPVAARRRVNGNASPFIETTTPIAISNARSMASALNYGASYNQVHIHNGEFLHNAGFIADNMVIAILDAGFYHYKTNPALDSVRILHHVLGERDYVAYDGNVDDDDPHGATCFTILASNMPGTIVGTAPHASYWLMRTEDVSSEYPVEEQNWAAAAELADSAGADIISTSLGYMDFDVHAFDHSYADRNGHTTIITRAANFAYKKGMIITVSAGNSGGAANDNKYVTCPADGDSVLTVGAVDNGGAITTFSSWGPNSSGQVKPDIVSVGQGTIGADPQGNLTSNTGTSFSNPNVCGLVACLWQAFPTLPNSTIMDAVKRSADKYQHPDGRYGYGLPDFKKAFMLLAAASFRATVNLNRCMAYFQFSGRDFASVRYEVQRKNSSGDFNTIATISAKGDMASTNVYSFTDLISGTTAGGQVTYRVNEVFGDTTLVVYSNSFTTAEACAAVNGLSIRPNPVGSEMTVAIGTTQPVQHMFLTVVDAKGALVYRWEGQKDAGNTYLTIPLPGLAHGIYLVTVRDGNKKLFTGKALR